MAKDYYQTLGVSKNATAEEIKKAFRVLAHKHHPDKTGGNEAKFKEINEAYQVLGDAEKRRKYDQFGSAAFEQGSGGFGEGGFGGFEGFSGFGDIDLGDMFGEAFGMGSRRGSRQRRGSDLEVSLTLAFTEAVFGVDREVTLDKTNACDRCGATGAEPGTKMRSCAACGGSGSRTQTHRTILGTMQTRTTCDACRGGGEEPEKKCETCRGAGIVRGHKTFTIHIPEGVEDGDVVRLRGGGEASGRGGSAGDLLLRIHVRPDPRFVRDGRSIRSEASIGFKTAALGGEVDVATVEGGTVMLKIPAGTQSGTEFRLRGKGVPHGSARGDHLVTVRVMTPTKLSKDQRRLLEEFEE